MGSLTAFDPRPLPAALTARLLEIVGAAHHESPFSTMDPRSTVRRTIALLDDLGHEGVVYRGGLDLRGVEVDHVWIGLAQPASEPGGHAVLDLAFPLFDDAFVSVLRRFVAGDAAGAELQEVGLRARINERVLGDFPARMRYVGVPLWGTAERNHTP